MIDLTGKQVKTKDGNVGVVISHEDRRLIIDVNGKTLRFEYPTVFKVGGFTAVDSKVQEGIMLDIASLDKANKESLRRQEEATQVRNENNKNSNSETTKKKNKFSSQYNADYLDMSQRFESKDIEDKYGINRQGFGRGINKTSNGKIVLFSSVKEKSDSFVYHDHFTDDGHYIYSGEGASGNQKPERGNKLILEAEKTKSKMELYISMSSTEYYYQGEFICIGHTYEDDKDENGNQRKEYKFKLEKVN